MKGPSRRKFPTAPGEGSEFDDGDVLRVDGLEAFHEVGVVIEDKRPLDQARLASGEEVPDEGVLPRRGQA